MEIPIIDMPAPIFISVIFILLYATIAMILGALLVKLYSRKTLRDFRAEQLNWQEVISGVLSVIITASVMSMMMMASYRFMTTGDMNTINWVQMIIVALSPFVMLAVNRWGFK